MEKIHEQYPNNFYKNINLMNSLNIKFNTTTLTLRSLYIRSDYSEVSFCLMVTMFVLYLVI